MEKSENQNQIFDLLGSDNISGEAAVGRFLSCLIVSLLGHHRDQGLE